MARVTLPLALRRSWWADHLLLEAIALFGAPAMIAIPARFNVVTTQLFQFFATPVRVEVAAAYAMPALGVTVLLIVMQRLIMRRRGFVALTGKGGERRPDPARPLALGEFGYAMFVAALSVFLPYSLPAAGGVRQGVGPRLRASTHLVPEFPLRAVRARDAAKSVINSFL